MAPQLILLPGRPVRGGGRAAGEGTGAGLAIEVSRLASAGPGRAAAACAPRGGQFGAALDFAATEGGAILGAGGRAGQRLALPQDLRAERTARELRFSVESGARSKRQRRRSAGAAHIVDDSRRNRRTGIRLRLCISACR